MVFPKAHFHDLFKRTIERVEKEFDKDFEDGLPLTLEGADSLLIRTALQSSTLSICEGVWDREHDLTNHAKEEYERLIYEHIVFLMYLLKQSQEEK